ncbi:accessory gene regulator B family protein [Niallia sp. NCCP-28]|uniref:accessory gene regulator B family protein n=1 Tax=Niallia sp. NCCP-28 TaxID=2934712 RepID=UPI0020BDB8A2|nr:accessory gene regulator B family protein [Niallia sp. NCCP-28]
MERYAIILADKIKRINPEETAPKDILVFGFTIIINLLITLVFLLFFSLLVGKTMEMFMIALSFMIMRMLTGGPHLHHALACSICSTILILIGTYLPDGTTAIFIYALSSLFLYIRYLPYYEKDQVVHSKEWEKKKKRFALLFLFLSFIFSVIFQNNIFLIGAFLQGVTSLPFMIQSIYKINSLLRVNGQ